LVPSSSPEAAGEEARPPSVSELPEVGAYAWRPFAGGFQQPLGLAHTEDDRLFLLEQRGVIQVIQEGEVAQEPFMDMRDRVEDGAFEQGLLGMDFHPDYRGNGLFYLYYTGGRGTVYISRFQVSGDPNRGDPSSEVVLLQIPEPYANHNGGQIRFGPDGYLYAGVGDGGSGGDPQGNGQNPETLLGSILRLDVDSGDPYGIPPDNPFVEGGGQPEVWAYGLRNPWRFSFDARGGDLYIGDVGQNQWEEIDFLPAGAPGGANFGWNLREGTHPFEGGGGEGQIDPVAQYRNAGEHCSVTGGVVVRDASLPEWNGVYLYGDYCSGTIWGLVRDAAGNWVSEPLFETAFRISSFGADRDGRVYVVDHSGGLYRLEAGG
jgi:glucose/arabinose dehydrogenase